MRRFNGDDDPEELTAWLAAGIRRVDAMNWRRWNFQLREALEWRKAGVADALTAAQWSAATVTPQTVGDWTEAGITASQAVRWHEFGYNLAKAREATKQGRGPESAFQQRQQLSATMKYSPIQERYQHFLQSGVPAHVLAGYLQSNWTDDEALTWAKLGIQHSDAKIWMRLGLTPPETKDLGEPMDVIEQWWRTGIPFDEVADWIGAGLTPTEAVEQRESGITQEQAAALRALRRAGGLAD
ncbi:hypothetical protein [Actinocrispum wychmicini]|uniref:Uncharacterized protein n=1 Tax=Actinocrispum wychmicini TaxID=1213861 RepID=A0A4R2K8I7_9PSEU|nr:hypothetical protein [Actinocrispum wychmicini]TCO62695.1 hypothetical protein EV192_102834 [Actinocrispum wychmicini]